MEQFLAQLRIGKRFVALCCALVAAFFAPLTASAIVPGTPGPGDVHFTINSTQNVKSISPWIYGANFVSISSPASADRIGGNRSTAYNWETNVSNAGSDWYYENDSGGGARAR